MERSSGWLHHRRRERREGYGEDDREARREPRTGVEELPFRPGAGISAHDPEAAPPLGRTRHRAANVLVLDDAPP